MCAQTQKQWLHAMLRNCAQVDTLSAQVADMTAQVKDLPSLQSTLDKSKRDQADAEQKLHVAVNENQQIQQQVHCIVLPA